jgi:GNAT superfamily N-acetyltransferase
MPLTIRPARLNERAELEAIVREASLAAAEGALPPGRPDLFAIPIDAIGAGLVSVAVWNERLVGLATIENGRRSERELSGLFVAPDQWRRGIATKLVREVERRARAEGATALVVTSAMNAVPFYAFCGFVDTGAATVEFGIARTMRKPLRA